MTALCRHFGRCGGCSHQDLTDAEYRTLKRRIVSDSLSRHGVETPMDELVEVAPATRRRAVFKAKRSGDGVLLGFHAARTHDIVDMQECLVLTPALAGLVPRLREMLAALLAPGEDAELRVTESDAGAEISLRWRRPNDTVTIAALARWAEKLRLARISAHGETVITQTRPYVAFGKATVVLPVDAFLQPTRDGEAVLQNFVRDALDGARSVADLFAGCGTFAFVLAEKARVHALEIDAAMLDALSAAVKTASGLKPITTEKRNLFRRPLSGDELARYDAVCLDPPRAGALEQVKTLARSKVKRIVYVSCDAETFARDARILVDGGHRLRRILPVDQFLWSGHIELAAAFER
jgi:23S rRNA (uracil1939-C5)-methyltransferase